MRSFRGVGQSECLTFARLSAPAIVGVVTRSVRKIFNSLPWEGCGWISWWQGGVYTSFQANKSVNKTPPYTLPGEGIAQPPAL